MPLVVIGSSFVDIKGYPFEKFIPDGRNAGRVEYVHGGVARNIAEDLANVGAEVTLLSLTDTSAVGQEVKAHLEKAGVNTEYIASVPDGLGTWLAVFNESGDVAASISKRPDMLPLAGVLDRRGDEIFRDAQGVLLELDIEEEIAARIFFYAGKHSVPVYAAVSNMSIASQRKKYFSKLSCLVCNLEEAQLLLGMPEGAENTAIVPEVVSKGTGEKGIARMVITMGGSGSMYLEGGKYCFCPAEKVKVVDTTGAGDAFFAGVSLALSRGMTPAQALRTGTRMAAKVISVGESVLPPVNAEDMGL